MERGRTERGQISIRAMSPDEAGVVFELVQALLQELGEEGEDTGELDRGRLSRLWRDAPERHIVLGAFDGGATPVGLLTLDEGFAFYAHGLYGVINEIYVAPTHRSCGVGRRLVTAAKEIAGRRGWTRIDVTAPESQRWMRTRQFYEREGFSFTGPKLKFSLDGRAGE